MQILYGYSNCTENLYHKIVSENNVAVMQPDQKYHSLMIKGFSKNGLRVKCYSGLPINRSVTKKLFINFADEMEDCVYYHYYRTINIPVIRQLMIFFSSFCSMLKEKKENDKYAICDCLNIANAYGFIAGARIRKIPIILIVTDLPDMIGTRKYIKKINNRLFRKANGFIFLTEAMNARVNSTHKPYIVIEGHVDAYADLSNEEERYEVKTGKKIIIYAGSLQKLYGIQNLVEGFLLSHIDNAELWIYGDGEYADELRKKVKEDHRIKYWGVKDNSEIVKAEQRASLLVNPRPIEPEYTKYSFPSKNMEYMVSGTPVLTTCLPGMPKEYYPYVYLLEDESQNGIAKKLTTILQQSIEERNTKARDARAFVLRNKSNLVQTKKIVKFIEEAFGND